MADCVGTKQEKRALGRYINNVPFSQRNSLPNAEQNFTHIIWKNRPHVSLILKLINDHGIHLLAIIAARLHL